MQQNLKYRLVGLAVILVSAAIIFPLLLDGEGYRERHLESVIPPAPEQPAIVRVSPEQEPLPDTFEPAAAEAIAVVEALPEPVAKRVEEKQAGVTLTEDAPVLDHQGVPVAWTLQLASFSDESNAKGLRAQLVDAGHKVYTRKQGRLIKVYVGPDLQRSNLEQLKARLEKEFGLDGIIVRFTTQ